MFYLNYFFFIGPFRVLADAPDSSNVPAVTQTHRSKGMKSSNRAPLCASGVTLSIAQDCPQPVKLNVGEVDFRRD
ncbi:hypothetical protein CEXT_379371 [Caerostris extrusa]|uniref:Secreted protein n=1 Tax=Caerostris extrusa TaxID=172846 RepID=A0AAV4YD14_CAEEX|nr:hypothetical protein CEXT_379371 [Caerostris extrusa]